MIRAHCQARGSLWARRLCAAATLVLINSPRVQTYSSVAGPFRIVPDHLQACPPSLDAQRPITFTVRGTRDRHNLDLWYYTVNFTTPVSWDDTRDLDVNLASWSSRGGWKDNAFVMHVQRACSSFRSGVTTLWRNVMKAIFDDPDHKCPLLPGTYLAKNVSSDFNMKYVPAFFYGKWRLTLRMMRSSNPRSIATETLGCIRAFGETVPRS